jgi:toxin secretion/phage lysis holin
MSDFIRWTCSVLCGIAGFLWGSLDGLILALIAFMILDYITGVIVGIIQKKLSSSTGFEGILKKGLILIVVSVGHILDTQLFGGESSVCRSAVIGFYIANEGISILENVGKMGLPLPEKLKKVLEQLKNNSER